MKIEEKRRILRNFCKNTTCDDCKLNSILYGWITPFGGEHCLDIDHSPECDLEKALALIGYVPNIQTDVSIKDDCSHGRRPPYLQLPFVAIGLQRAVFRG